MLGVQPRRRDPRAGFADQTCDGERVIDVPVRQEDSLDRKRVPTAPPQRPAQRGHAPDKTRVNQVQSALIPQDMKADEGRPDRENISIHRPRIVGDRTVATQTRSACIPAGKAA